MEDHGTVERNIVVGIKHRPVKEGARSGRLLARKYGMFTAGVIFSALGISLITKAGLGTSPVTSLAYVLTFILPRSLGTFTMLVNTCMFFMQIAVLGKRFRRIQFLQLPAALLFSACIDGWMHGLSFWEPVSYMSRIAVLLAGCVSLGFGISLEVVPDVLILPGEGLVRAISQRMTWEFGRVKTVFDLGLVAAAVLVSYLHTGRVLGIREGTVVAALMVGTISHFFIQRIKGDYDGGESAGRGVDAARGEACPMPELGDQGLGRTPDLGPLDL